MTEMHEKLENGKLVLFHVSREVKHPHFIFMRDNNGKSVRYWRRSKIVHDTIAVLTNDNGTFNIGVSYQSPEDNYNRKDGNIKAYAKANGTMITNDWKEPVVVNSIQEVKDSVLNLITNKYKSKTISIAGMKDYSLEDTIEWIEKVMNGEHRKPKT